MPCWPALDGKDYTITKIEKGKRRPSARRRPFITSTLQQDASRAFGFSATRTMRAAQTLYEGVDDCGARHGGSDHLHAYRLAAHRCRGAGRRQNLYR